eukprot:scaffold76538_cov62-Attheya_sp.AAC.2
MVIDKRRKNAHESSKIISDTGNRTPVSRVTGGDTSHYTMSEECASRESNPGPNLGKTAHFKMGKKISDTGNRTPVSRVTGGDTSHYTMSD